MLPWLAGFGLRPAGWPVAFPRYPRQTIIEIVVILRERRSEHP
jgi:hypothetical protein